MLTAAIARYLDAQDLGVFDDAGATLFLEELPAEPVDAVAVKFTPAPPADYSDWTVSAIQILVRTSGGSGGRARSGYSKAREIRDALHGLRHVTLAPGTPDEARLATCISETVEPINLGDDTNGRPRWSLRLLCTIHNPTPLTIS